PSDEARGDSGPARARRPHRPRDAPRPAPPAAGAPPTPPGKPRPATQTKAPAIPTRYPEPARRPPARYTPRRRPPVNPHGLRLGVVVKGVGVLQELVDGGGGLCRQVDEPDAHPGRFVTLEGGVLADPPHLGLDGDGLRRAGQREGEQDPVADAPEEV